MKLFYDHLVDRSKFVELIEREGKSEKERKKLAETVDEMIHHTVLDVIFVHLDEKHHEEFLVMMHEAPHSEEILVYIKEKGHPQIEEKIREEVKKLMEGIIREISTE